VTAATITALALSGVVGLSLGALGGGGSILTLPLFVFVAGIAAREAVPMSMVVVGGTSLVGAALHFWRGNFNSKAALLFAAGGIFASYLGSYLTHLVSEHTLLGMFAGLMLVVGMAMLRDRPVAEVSERCFVARCMAIGFSVGGLTGFLGIGGGFVIVPALILFAGIEPRRAVGTSLAIISLDAASGLLGHIQQTAIDWPLTLGFLGLALLGMLGGLAVAEKISSRSLQRAFAWFIIFLGALIGMLTATGISLPSREF